MRHKGKHGFHDYFQIQYKKRWDTLQTALLGDKNYMSIPPKTTNLTPYYIDKASYFLASLCAHYINTHHRTSDNVIPTLCDMCAAPGGKLIHILNTVHNTLNIYANDISTSRMHRLKQNLQNYIHTEQHSLHMSSKNASTFGKTHANFFDFVLLDAPCSNERHVLQNKKELLQWNSLRCIRDAQTQTALLCAAIDACKPNGLIIYSTCSLSEIENEKVITRVTKKRNIKPISLEIKFDTNFSDIVCEETQIPHAHIILPDKAEGAGPLFFISLQKV